MPNFYCSAMVDDDFEAMLREAAEEMQADDPSAAAPSAADLLGSSSGSSASAAATSATEPAAVDAAAALDADAAALKAARSDESPAAETSGGNDGHVDEADSDQDSDASSAAGGDLSRGRANRASEWDLEELAAVRRGREKVPFKHRVVKEVKSSLRRFYTAGRITSKACALASNSLKPHVAKLSPLTRLLLLPKLITAHRARPTFFPLQEDFKYLAKRLTKKILVKEGGPKSERRPKWDSKTAHKIKKYCEAVFAKSFVFVRQESG